MIIKKSLFDSASQASFGSLIPLDTPDIKPIVKHEISKVIAFQERIANLCDREFEIFEKQAINRETNLLNRHASLLPFLNKVKAERERYKLFDLACYQRVIKSPEPVYFKWSRLAGDYVYTELFSGTTRIGDNCYEYATKGIFQATNNSPFFLGPGFANGIVPYDQRSYLDAICMDLAAFNVGMRFVPNYNPSTYTPTPGKTLCYGVYGYDYHFYRLDSEYGYWTHKPGSTPVTCFDLRGDLITNPATCAMDRQVYTHEIGFFEINLP